MARLASIEKAGYYPTPDRPLQQIIDFVNKSIKYRTKGLPTTIFDPCAGKGTAVAGLARGIAGSRGRTYAVELDSERAAAAQAVCHKTINAGIEDILIEGTADIMLLNPPYDTNGDGSRAEIEFLYKTARRAGLTIYIVPDRFVEGGENADDLKNALYETDLQCVKCLKFPEPEYNNFKQVVMFLRPGHQRSLIEIDGILGEDITWTDYQDYRSSGEKFGIVQADNLAGMESITVTKPEALDDITGAAGAAIDMRPLLPMRDEHAALIAAAGMLNGLKIGHLIIRGSTHKKTVVRKRIKTDDDTGNDYDEEAHRETFTAALTILNTRTGEISSINSGDHAEQFSSFLLLHARRFVEAAKELYPPVCSEETAAGIDLSFARAPRRIEGRPDALLTKQEETAKAVITAWNAGNKVTTLVGEMSTGKTTMSLVAAAYMASKRAENSQKIIILCPAKADLADKWQAEAETVLRELNAWTEEIKSITELRAAMERPGIGALVIRETQAKASTPWENIQETGIARRYRTYDQDGNATKHREPKCPKCAKALNQANMLIQSRKHKCQNMLETCPACGEPASEAQKEDTKKRNTTCENCGSSLICNHPHWTFKNENKKRRYPISKYLSKHYARRYVLIIDEVHNMKGGDTNRGQVTQQMIKASKYALQMTGTLYGGKASTIFYLLYRACPTFRALYHVNGQQRFVNDYGLTETITKTYESIDPRTNKTGYQEFVTEPEEIPGMHPAMAALLLPTSAFVSLRDFDFEMPEYSEHVLLVEPGVELKAQHSQYISNLKQKGIERWKDDHDKSVLSQWMWARYGILDRPDVAEEIDGITYTPPEDCSEPFMKEEALLRLIHRERSRGRKCLCYVQQMNRRDPTPRLLKLMEKHGLKGAVMRATVTKRIDYIKSELKAGADVIFTSAKLVSEGIDIVECPTIIWYGHEFSVYIMPQANRRSYRLNQTKAVEIYYLAYNDTEQAEAMIYIARKLKAAQAIQGDVANGLAALKGDDDFIDELNSLISEQQHYESDIDINDLPELPEIDLQLLVELKAAAEAAAARPVRRELKPVDPAKVEQLDMFAAMFAA